MAGWYVMEFMSYLFMSIAYRLEIWFWPVTGLDVFQVVPGSSPLLPLYLSLEAVCLLLVGGLNLYSEFINELFGSLRLSQLYISTVSTYGMIYIACSALKVHMN